MLSLLPIHKSLASLDGRFVTNTVLPACWQSTDDLPLPVGFRTCAATESRLPRDREDPCSFRTRLIDPAAGAGADLYPDMDVEGADNTDDNELKFDDTQCISIGRSTSNVKPVSGTSAFLSHNLEDGSTVKGGITTGLHPLLHSSPVALANPADDPPPATYKPPNFHPPAYRAVSISELDADSNSDDDGNTMETLNMPFWNVPRREKRHSAHHRRHGSDTIPDDMSIISDASLVPTYFPSDAAKRQGQQRPQHRALIRHLFRAKARAARQTMRELKRSCRDVVGNVFVEGSAASRVPKCVAVGAAP